MDFETSIIVERPREVAFHACDSPELQVRWIGSLLEVIIEPERPWGVGARFKQIHREAGVQQEFEGEVVAYVPNELIGLRLRHSQFELESELRFEDLGVRCRITQKVSVALRSMMLKMIKGTVRGTVEQRIHDDFERLRGLLESEE